MIVQRADGFAAIFTAFQTQCLPTDARGISARERAPLARIHCRLTRPRRHALAQQLSSGERCMIGVMIEGHLDGVLLRQWAI